MDLFKFIVGQENNADRIIDFKNTIYGSEADHLDFRGFNITSISLLGYNEAANVTQLNFNGTISSHSLLLTGNFASPFYAGYMGGLSIGAYGSGADVWTNSNPDPWA